MNHLELTNEILQLLPAKQRTLYAAKIAAVCQSFVIQAKANAATDALNQTRDIVREIVNEFKALHNGSDKV